MNPRCLAPLLLGLTLLLGACGPSHPPTTPPSVPDSEWTQYGRDHGGERFSSLQQIHRDNVEYLDVAWVYQAGELQAIQRGEQPFNPWQATPLLLDDTLITCTPTGRVIALDAVTGAERWTFDPDVSFSSFGHSFVKCRGVSSYLDPGKAEGDNCRRRIIWGTADLRVFALDARSGQRCADFGVGDNSPGEIQFDAGGPLDFQDEVQIHAPPAMAGHVAVFGSTLADMLRIAAPSGMIRAIDARSGELLWTFDPVPRDADDPASAAWRGDSYLRVGAGNAWSLLSADPDNNLVFVPTTSPSADLVGDYRVGDNRYTDSLVALKADTGEVAWHFQFVHHDLWDYDLAAQPLLMDLEVDGEVQPAVIQATKMGHVFILHRETGEPLYPVEERAVPQTDIPGEYTSPTQPFPTFPKPLHPYGVNPDDARGVLYFDKKACREKIEAARNEGIFTPPALNRYSIQYPGVAGGQNWGGMALDAKNKLLVMPQNYVVTHNKLIPRDEAPAFNDDEAGMGVSPNIGTPFVIRHEVLLSPLGAPCLAPPWGKLLAVSLETGDIVWEVPFGTPKDMVPGLSWLPLQFFNMGFPSAGGPVVTGSGLVFIGAAMDNYLRAYDSTTGEELWRHRLPAGAQATPMTFRGEKTGKQFVVIAAGGHAYMRTQLGDSLVAFALGD